MSIQKVFSTNDSRFSRFRSFMRKLFYLYAGKKITGYICAFFLLLLTLLVTRGLQNTLPDLAMPTSIWILSCMIVALFWGLGPTLFILIVGLLELDYFIIEPHWHWGIMTWPNIIQSIPLLLAGTLVARVSTQLRYKRVEALQAKQQIQQYANELIAMNKKLREADAVKDQFLSIASHEVKTPIASIRGYAQLLKRRLNKHGSLMVEQTLPCLESVEEQTGQLTNLINDLLDASSRQDQPLTLKLEPCDLTELAQSVAENLRLVSGREIVLQSETGSVLVSGDRNRLIQILTNLINNAIKYSPSTSPVHVAVKQNNTQARIEVQDAGSGIAPEDLPHIFELFYRASDVLHSKVRGSGLGLAIVQRLITAHGGRVWCESEVGCGSTFFIELPLLTHYGL